MLSLREAREVDIEVNFDNQSKIVIIYYYFEKKLASYKYGSLFYSNVIDYLKSFMTLTTGFGMTGKACTSGGSDGTLTDTGF